MLQFICDLTVKSTVLLLIATAISMTLRKSSAAARHRLWGLTMISLLGMPLLPFLTPTIWSLTVPPDVAVIPSAVPAQSSMVYFPNDSTFAAPSFWVANAGGFLLDESTDSVNVKPVESAAVNLDREQSSSINWISIASCVPFVWAVGTLLVLLNLVVGTWRVVRFKNASIPVADSAWLCFADEVRQRLSLKKTVELREHPGDVVPMTLGVIRPVVVLPRLANNWPDRLKRTVLLHELAHVRRRDVAYQWLGRLACAVYWFHPLAWLGLRKLRQEREQACDDLVIHCGERATEYAEDLVMVAKNLKNLRGLACAVAMARHGNLEGRMRSLFDADVVRSHAPLGRIPGLTLLLLVGVIAVSVSAVRLAAQSEDKQVTGRNTDPANREEAPATIGDFIQFAAQSNDEAFYFADDFDEDRNYRDRKPGPLRHTVTVINDEGEPVVGAKVIPRGFGTSDGSGWGWIELWPTDFSTDEKGIAVILVPEERLAIVPAGEGDIKSVSFNVEHPGYAPASKSMVYISDRRPIALSRGVIVAPRAVDATTNQPITSDLFAFSSGYSATHWTNTEGGLRSAPIDTTDSETGKYFRVIHAPSDPPNSPVLFSDVIDATKIEVKDRIAAVDVPLFHGVRLAGKLSANVPRPLKKGGHVVASMSGGDMDRTKYRRQTVGWGDVAMIDEDGNFEFSYLPRESQVELIAVCDGWVSKAKSEDLAEYDRIHQTGFQDLNTGSAAASTPVFIDRENVAITLDMVQMGSCEFLVEDENGRPLDLATIHCMPNHHTRAGGSHFGYGGRSLDYLRNPQTQTRGEWTRGLSQYSRTTGSDGHAVISNLPAELQMFQVVYPGYQMPQDPRFGGGFRMGAADIKSGRTTKLTVRMIPETDAEASLLTGLFGEGGSVPILFFFVDSEGAPLPDVRVTPREQSLQNPNERQPWPSEWTHEVTTDIEGTAKLQVHIPANLSPDVGSKIGIWFDAECPGFVPLRDHEYSLTKHLTIRMQAN